MTVRSFSRIGDALEVGNLADLQAGAYRRFVQPDCLPDERLPIGLEAVFREIFPLEGPDRTFRMEYLGYELGVPTHDELTCRHLGLTYSWPLRLRLRVVGAESIEEDVYVGDLPRMIGSGEFIINGSERVVVAQIQRSPGVDFAESTEESGRVIHSFRFIPERGVWVEFTVNRKDALLVRLGQSGKMPATWLLRAMLGEAGGSDEGLLGLFYEHENLSLDDPRAPAAAEGRFLAGEIVNSETGELVARAGSRISRELAEGLAASGVKELAVLKGVDDLLLLHTLESDPCHSHAEALLRIYARFRPGEPASVERAAAFFADRFANTAHYSLGAVGRFRVNRKFQQEVPTERLALCPEDILNGIKYLMRLRHREGVIDDIDDLGNRVLRPIDRLLGEAVREGGLRWARGVRDQLVSADGKAPSPRNIAGNRALASAIQDFFTRSELCQVVDQTNPLAELTHVRRISALGPGGLNRKRAGFEVRDVHASHYGRICPIETPEGANIGLIASLGIFARVDEYGFLTTPYRAAHTEGGAVDVRYLRADEERGVNLAPALPAEAGGEVQARFQGELGNLELTRVDLVDVSPKQMLGVSASLIPFLEHNDANRALMGSNMQRQAVPLLRTERPLVGTGMERAVAANSGMVVCAGAPGMVTEVDATHVRVDDTDYPLRKYQMLNENTCLNQKPIVCEGERVAAGQVLADGAATSQGELSLGRNVLAAFMIWDGFNFEDAIIVSESLCHADKYTSIHIEEFSIELRETRVGREEFTRDIPSVSERMLTNLDEHGIIRLGTKVRPDDILVGKVAPKTKTELTPEERLLREIFGKAGEDVTNESLTVPPGSGGIVVDVRHFRRRTHLPDEERRRGLREARRVAESSDIEIAQVGAAMIRELAALRRAPGQPPLRLLDNATVREMLRIEQEFRFDVETFAAEERVRARDIYRSGRVRLAELKARRDALIRDLRIGDELPSGVLEMVKIFIAVKRPLSAGDKMAGRHGNKGVIARVVPREDMPFLPDGTPVEIVLNPLGVPSRMNVGQILETHLAWAGQTLGFRAICPVFESATEQQIRDCLREAGLPEDGKTALLDGRTGEAFDQKVTVGYIYMMKLNHLVDDKIHARATGPYSLITQQPLGGKARRGGQRLGEMEVWAIEAYGAAYLLQEMLTVKSDDTEGRVRIYESMVKGKNVLEASTPVSVDVLMQEVRGLGLNMRLVRDTELSPAAAGPRIGRRKETT